MFDVYRRFYNPTYYLFCDIAAKTQLRLFGFFLGFFEHFFHGLL